MAPKIPLSKLHTEMSKPRPRYLKVAHNAQIQGQWADAQYDVILAMMVREIQEMEDKRFLDALNDPNAHWMF